MDTKMWREPAVEPLDAQMNRSLWRDSPQKARWKDALLAVLAGNVIYFLLVEPHLPERLRHHAFQIDSGLVIDFLVCFAVFAVVRCFRKA